MIVQIILWLALFSVLGVWAISDNRQRRISDLAMKAGIVGFGCAYIIAAISNALSYSVLLGIGMGIAIIIIMQKQIQPIDKAAIGMSFIGFPYIGLGTMGIYLIIHIVDVKMHKANYYSAFLTKYFISFVIASCLALPFVMHWY